VVAGGAVALTPPVDRVLLEKREAAIDGSASRD
jgi:hypothetical protein